MVGLVEFFAICLSHGNFSFDKDPLGFKHRRDGMQKDDVIKNIDIKQLKIKTHFSKRNTSLTLVNKLPKKELYFLVIKS